jgi:hypothetical protein
VFEYYDPAVGGTLSATATLYANPGGLDLGTSPLAGPFVRNGLPRGRGRVAIPMSLGLAAITDLWVGVQFSSATAGLIIRSTPSIGSSHDFYLENGGFYWFGGEPRANFGVRIVGSPAVLPVGGGSEPTAATLAPAQREREAGHHAERWSGRDDAGRLVEAGVYFVRLESSSGVITRSVSFAR